MHRQVLNAVDAGDGDIEVRRLRRRVAAVPSDSAARLALAEHYEKSGYPELAIDHLRQVLASDAAHTTASLRLAATLERMTLREEALSALEAAAVAKSEADAALQSAIGIAKDRLGRFADAEQHHRAAVVLASQNDRYHNNLGYYLMTQRRFPEAIAEFETALKLVPRSEVARNNLGLALARSSNGDEMREKALLNWKSAYGPASAHTNLAAVLMETGDYAAARRELAVALSFEKKFAPALRNLRLVSELDGKPASVELAAARTDARDGRFSRFAKGLKRAFVLERDETPNETRNARAGR